MKAQVHRWCGSWRWVCRVPFCPCGKSRGPGYGSAAAAGDAARLHLLVQHRIGCGCGRERGHDPSLGNWRCAMGAVSVPLGTELPEVTIRRMRDAS